MVVLLNHSMQGDGDQLMIGAQKYEVEDGTGNIRPGRL